MRSHYHLSGKSDEHMYECTRKKGASMSENVQRREIHPVDTSSSAETHPVPPALHMIRPGTSRVLLVHLSKHHSLVVAFMKQSDAPPGPFNAVSNISLDDFCTTSQVLFYSAPDTAGEPLGSRPNHFRQLQANGEGCD